MPKKETLIVHGKEWTKDDVKALIGRNRDAQVRALMIVYHGQTDHEKMCGHCSDLNGKGFTKFDSKLLTSIAQWYERKGYLSDKQYGILEWKMPKYYKQVWAKMKRDALVASK